MTGNEAHPSAEQIEAAVFGWISGEQAEAVRVHASQCPRCQQVLADEEMVSRALARLRREPLAVDMVRSVLDRLGQGTFEDSWGALARGTVVTLTLAVALGGLVLVLSRRKAGLHWIGRRLEPNSRNRIR